MEYQTFDGLAKLIAEAYQADEEKLVRVFGTRELQNTEDWIFIRLSGYSVVDL